MTNKSAKDAGKSTKTALPTIAQTEDDMRVKRVQLLLPSRIRPPFCS
ncbi:MAG: hypothetical protein WBE34_13575 [Candidatus Nitrosopolaris sp.]